ncbi:hypothetical protein PNOK_0115800 [Pyrrhoderma noxium]|uniref:DUF6534 domain-containing protein n=1 Tax=Pyrrhoderma noxium TaxID=2282107 RepID=A0A286UWX0_9AGAM|nr:hypothetical protein PNOK_0115800 [Pyrrhoderma noxium]
MSGSNYTFVAYTQSPIAESHGPILIGIFISCLLYGASMVQIWNYFSVYKHDRLWMRLYIGLLLIEDTVNTAFAIAWIYNLVITNFGNVEPFGLSNWLLETDPLLGAIISFSCQAFFTWRLHCLVKRWWIPILILIPSLAGTAGGISASIILRIHPDLSDLRKFTPYLYFWLIPTVAADFIITGMMIYFLRQRRTSFARTESILNKIIRLAIQSCLLTTIVTLADIISFVVTPLPIHIAFSYCTPKLYTNSVLSSLNSRPNRRFETNEQWELPSSGQQEISLSELRARGISGNDGFASQNATGTKPGGTEVYIDVSTHIAHDTSSKGKYMQDDDDSLPGTHAQ